MKAYKSSLLVATALSLLASACAERVFPATAYVRKHPELESSWAPFLPGRTLALWGGAACDGVRWSRDRKGLSNPSANQEPLAGPALVRVEAAEAVVTSGGGYVALFLQTEAGELRWAALPPDASSTCLGPVTEAFAAARSLVGQTVTFAPWQPECKRIVATGSMPGALLIDQEPGSTRVKVESLVYDGEPMAVLNGDALRVAADTLTSCFSAAVDRPTSVEELLHVPLGRCERRAGDHLECRSTLGVWEGVNGPNRLALSLRYRTVGPAHFVGEALVDGRHWARSVVALELTAPQRGDARLVANAVMDVLRRHAAQSSEAVRIVIGDDPDATLRAFLALDAVEAGRPVYGKSTRTSEFVARHETRPNPLLDQLRAKLTATNEKIKTLTRSVADAEEAVRTAERDLTIAERDYAESEERLQQQVEEAKAEARRQFEKCQQNASNAIARASCSVGQVGVDIGASFIHASRANVESAEDALRQARARHTALRTDLSEAELDSRQTAATLQQTPPTVVVPITETWTYPVDTVTRRATARVRLRLVGADGVLRDEAFDFTEEWNDYKASADAAHNVPEHRWEERFIDDSSAILDKLAGGVRNRLASELAMTARSAQREDARKRLAARGLQGRGKWQDVDAEAYSIAGDRLHEPVVRSAVVLAGEPVELPTKAAIVGEGECLVVVGVGDAEVALSTPDRSHADPRKSPAAALELCKEELATGEIPPVLLSGPTGHEVKWGIFRVHKGRPGEATN